MIILALSAYGRSYPSHSVATLLKFIKINVTDI